MGDLIGHVIPGTFFGVFAIWWAWSIFHRYYASHLESRDQEKQGRGRTEVQFRSSVTFPCTSCCTGIPVEAICIVFFATLGVIVEFLSFCIRSNFKGLVQPQHMLMYTFFALYGIVVILLHYRFPLPPGSDYAMGILAFAMEGFLFAFHLHERSPLDIRIHQFLVYTIFATIIAAGLEMRYKNSVLLPLCRTYLTLLQGTWFYQIGIILYPLSGEPWEAEGHHSMMKATIVFGCHNFAILLFLMLLGAWVFLRVRNMGQASRKRFLLHNPSQESALSKYVNDLEHGGHLLLDSEEEIVSAT